jgi:hypothetical protein
MKKIGEYALETPAQVLSRSEPHSADVLHQAREELRQQCEADLGRYVGGLRTLRDMENNDDSHDE